jgi:hypothetical protein
MITRHAEAAGRLRCWERDAIKFLRDGGKSAQNRGTMRVARFGSNGGPSCIVRKSAAVGTNSSKLYWARAYPYIGGPAHEYKLQHINRFTS